MQSRNRGGGGGGGGRAGQWRQRGDSNISNISNSSNNNNGNANPGGGRGGRRGRGRGGRGGRGQQAWWDPVWRAERLKQIREECGNGHKREHELVDEDEWQEKIKKLKVEDTEQEIVIKRNFSALGTELLKQIAKDSGLHFHGYNKGRSTVLVVSKVPLPSYRADLDEKNGTRQCKLKMSAKIENRVTNVLARFNDDSTPTLEKEKINIHPNGNGGIKGFSAVRNPPNAMEDHSNISSDKTKRSSELRDQQRKLQASASFKAMLQFRQKLPTFTRKQELLQAVAKNQVLVISGETGCGKTTQLPQFILEEAIEAGDGVNCNIICTQPRRISAISVATRVATERGENLGVTVGYQIRLEAKRSAKTRLLFCTTGVLLRRLIQDPRLSGVSHIFVDEIHERGMNEDFLLIILRDLITLRPDLHLILMSATINAELFSTYFSNAPIFHIPGFTFPVQEYFLEDVLDRTSYIVNTNNTTKRMVEGEANGWSLYGIDIDKEYKSYSIRTRQSLQSWRGDKIDLGLVEATIEYICRHEKDGAILVFLTGWDDISKLHDNLKANSLLGDNRRFLLVPLHGSMPTINQKDVFQRPPKGSRKIVLATNIAETSITIDDVVYVVDCGRAKEKSYDALNKLACLTPSPISKASADQRRGRAGRVQPGVCYHLYPRVVYESLLQYQLPEILRTPLQELCLQIKSLQLGSIAEFLAKALQPPESLAVENAINLLKTIGALDDKEDLTALGQHLATLPVDPRVGKMLLMGAVFGCLDPALTIAAALAHRDPFVLPMDKKNEADEARRRFAGNSYSDHIAILKAYEAWQAAKRNGYNQQFCWRNFLSSSALQMMEDLRTQFLDVLCSSGFVNKANGLKKYNRYSTDLETLRAILCAGMFPNIAQCKEKGKRSLFYTREDGRVNPHPSSVISEGKHFPHPWFVYGDKVKTSGIYLRDSTNVSNYVLLMFGGSLVADDKGSVVMLGGYLHFSASKKIVQLVQGLRQKLDMILQKKIECPQVDIHVEGKEIVTTVIELLHSVTK